MRNVLRFLWKGENPTLTSGERPLVPTRPLRPVPLSRKDQQLPVGLQICIDFGTSASAVALAGDEKNHKFAVLGYDADTGERRTIGSSVLWLNEDVPGEEVLIMGSENYRDLLTSGREISRSLKRLLFDYDLLQEEEQARIRQRLRAILRELLLLALAPRHSSTLAELAKLQSSKPADLNEWRSRGGFRWTETDVEKQLRMNGEICLCVPNSFGAQPIAVATEALRAALGDISSAHKELRNIINCSVRLLREAEAIAWAAVDEIRERQRVLIVDVGAGTTDVAVVENSGRLPRLRMRSGIPFGGDDVDQLLLVLASAQAKAESEAAQKTGGAGRDVVPLETIDTGQKSILLVNARAGKESWSMSRSQAAPLPASIPVLYQGSASSETRELLEPHHDSTYRKFLQYAISATCTPLLRELERRELPLGSVILSGSSSALPQVRETVQGLLGSVGMPGVEIHSIGDRLRPYDEFGRSATDVRRAKLACAWGAAESAHDWGTSRDLRQYVPETITVKHNDFEQNLFEAGMTFAHGELTRYLPLRSDGEGHKLLFYRYFCPSSELIDEGDRYSPWLRRLIGRLTLDADVCSVGVRLTLSDQAPSFQESLDTWLEERWSPHQMRKYPPDVLEQPPGDTERNPVTALPMNWAWLS